MGEDSNGWSVSRQRLVGCGTDLEGLALTYAQDVNRLNKQTGN